jgi:hypothetical protein
MKSSSALTAAKLVFRWLRWVAVLAYIYFAWSGLLYVVIHNDIAFHSFPLFLLVAAGAKIAPRYRLVTALVMAAVLLAHSFWAHLLANQGPWVTTYEVIISSLQQIVLQGMPAGGPVRHFLLEALGAVLGVVYILWSERRRAFVASVWPDSPPT